MKLNIKSGFLLKSVRSCFLGLVIPVSFAFAPTCFAESKVALEKMKWPASNKCLKCISIQYGLLSMKIPIDDFGKIYVQDHEMQFLSIIPKAKGSINWSIIGNMPEGERLESFRKKGLLEGFDIATNEEFFDLLGDGAVENDALVKIRHIMRISRAERYVKMSKGNLLAYWIKDGKTDSVYFFVNGGMDGGDAYQLFGNFGDGFLKRLIANIEVSNRP
jgi:hypothetical protein